MRPATPGTPAWAAVVGTACWLAAPTHRTLAQTTATVDLGISTVRYDGFLASGAAALGPSLKWEGAGRSVTAQGSYLRFESGNHSLQGTLTGSLFVTPAPRWQGQVVATLGASSYAHFSSFWHAIGEARLHRVATGGRGGAWIGAGAGRASFGDGAHLVTAAAVGVWAHRPSVTLLASLTRAFVGDTAYSDVEAAVRGRHGTLTLEGYAGARVWSRGAGRGVYGEGRATLPLSQHLALVVSGGRYPTDPIRGTISGRYASAALRLHTAPPRRLPAPRHGSPQRWSHVAGTSAPSGVVALEVRPEADGRVRLRVDAPDASLVEVAGDFSDWQPLALRRAPDGRWDAVVRLSAGAQRIGIRVDGGRWIAPEGVTRTTDDYGGEVGIIVVP